ncbi:hypothetical protein ONS95_006377 [Cadophora gregata]|uniref:uncharacterized protein n=1 Tax=Cadophora gregata TaxID=51156 RepID=UPI0026DAFA5B|nr:uncharacterized protein ONS95_006377 [Cadophora gregata]KAK0102780.1 hypothetical protein ONS95_006377 [Cadophora gregata]
MVSSFGILGLDWTTIAASSFLVYIFTLIIYRLFLDPLSKFPGPKLAAATLWYEFYYDVIKTGTYMAEIKKMHEKYGPIVRISPYELHVNDPDFYEELYAGGGRKRNKYAWFVRLFGMTDGSLATIDHDHHRLRRGAISPFFSKTNVRKLEPVIQGNVEKLMRRLETLEGTGKPVNLNVIFGAFTSDIIIEYAFGESQGYLDKEDFNVDFFQMMDSIHHIGAAAKQFGWLLPIVLSIPDWITTRIDKGTAAFAKMQNTSKSKLAAIIESSPSTHAQTSKSTSTIFHDILTSTLLPPSEKSLDRLYQEGQTFIAAGTETTAWCLTVIIFYLLSNPEIMKTLKDELDAAERGVERKEKRRSSVQLEKLPYLSAVIMEGLRLSFGVCTRLPRIATGETLVLRDGGGDGGREKVWRIPPWTPVSMSAGIQHLDPRIFPSPLEFQPSRWLNNKSLEKYLVSFSKGSRQCVGINLAYAELYLCLSALVVRYGGAADGTGNGGPKMRLFETGREDVEMQRDLFIPGVKAGSKGVRVVFEK